MGLYVLPEHFTIVLGQEDRGDGSLLKGSHRNETTSKVIKNNCTDCAGVGCKPYLF